MICMPEENQPALLSIGGLSRLSGVPVETLRTWERRYGWPVPVRLASGHRRYPSALVPHLRLVRRALDVGLKASFAVAAPKGELEIAVQQATAAEAPQRKTPIETEYEKEVARWIEQADAWDASGLDVSLIRSWAHFARSLAEIHIGVDTER